MTCLDKIRDLYRSVTGKDTATLDEIKGSGSSRRYFRVGDNPQLIATAGYDTAENDAFLYLTEHFSRKHLAVPSVLAVSPDRDVYIQTDNGAHSLFDSLDRDDLIVKAMEALADMQYQGAEGLDFSRCYPVPAMDRQAIMWDLNYFKYCFLKNTPVEFSDKLLEEDFRRMASDLAVNDDEHTFMVRDFQSRNVLVNGDDVTIIDYQGGRRGPVEYDVASFAWQARAGFSPEKRSMIIEAYLKAASRYRPLDRVRFMDRLGKYVFLRQLQTLGAYGYRGLVQKKAHFVRSIPKALINLEESITDSYPYLASVLKEMISVMSPRFAVADKLLVKVGSFSFMQGIPEDMSGNGGGFVFDCRGLPNPGRYDEYKKLTGRDKTVIEFLEKCPEIYSFVDAAKQMTGISVATYKERGFTSLMINFGCTGGRHRSVYCAEAIARYIHSHFNVDVLLTHREQNISELLQAK
ncbi:MAG: phosphotransferase [Barnesiella sp.]|nr:phosphotransferase [Barnesiella sp.]